MKNKLDKSLNLDWFLLRITPGTVVPGCQGCVCNVNFRVEILGCPPHHKNTCAASLLQEKGNRDQNRGIDVPVHAYVHG